MSGLNAYTPSVYDNRVQDTGRVSCTWGELVEQIEADHIVVNKKDESMLITPCRFKLSTDDDCVYAEYTEHEASKGLGKEGTVKFDEAGNPYAWKGALNVVEWSLLPVDIDGGMSLVQAVKRFKDYEYVLYTSFSHRKEGVDKFRMLFLLQDSMTPDEVENRKHAIGEWIGLDNYDKSSTAKYRGFYLPSCTAGNLQHARFFHNSGQLLDLKSFDESIAAAPVRTLIEHKDTSLMKELILKKLTQIGNVEYPVWFAICCGMKDAGYSYSDFEYVSRYLRSHRTSADFKSNWKRANSRRSKQTTMGSVVRILKDRLGEACLV